MRLTMGHQCNFDQVRRKFARRGRTAAHKLWVASKGKDIDHAELGLFEVSGQYVAVDRLAPKAHEVMTHQTVPRRTVGGGSDCHESPCKQTALTWARRSCKFRSNPVTTDNISSTSEVSPFI